MNQEDLRNIIYGGKVFLPETIEELQNFVRENSEIMINKPGKNVLSLEKLNKIEIDFGKKEVYVEAGVLLSDLQFELKKKGLEFPIYPLFPEIETVGSLLAINVSGSRGIKYERAGDWVRELEIVDADGQLVRGDKTDFSDFIGMEGITGIIVRTKLKVIDEINRTATLLKIKNIEKIIEIVKKTKLMHVSMIFFLSKEISELIGLEREYHLFIEFEDQRGKLKGKQYDARVKQLKEIYESLCLADYTKIEDIKIYIYKLPDFLFYTESMKIPVFGYLGTGILHPVFPRNIDTNEMLKLVRKLHGKVYAEKGVGKDKKQFFDENDIKLIQRVKKRQDPTGKFNQGIMIDYKPDEGEQGENE